MRSAVADRRIEAIAGVPLAQRTTIGRTAIGSHVRLSLDPPMSLGLSGCRNGEMPLGSGKIELV